MTWWECAMIVVGILVIFSLAAFLYVVINMWLDE
jgi:hypothetical protein